LEAFWGGLGPSSAGLRLVLGDLRLVLGLSWSDLTPFWAVLRPLWADATLMQGQCVVVVVVGPAGQPVIDWPICFLLCCPSRVMENQCIYHKFRFGHVEKTVVIQCVRSAFLTNDWFQRVFP